MLLSRPKAAGSAKIIGVSCQTISQARRAKDSADYIGFGSVYKTKTKSGAVKWILSFWPRSVRKYSGFFISGIGLENVSQIINMAGSARYSRAICQAADVVGHKEILKVLRLCKKAQG